LRKRDERGKRSERQSKGEREIERERESKDDNAGVGERETTSCCGLRRIMRIYKLYDA
jgi:hypothetical protein